MLVWDDTLHFEKYKKAILGTNEHSFAQGINQLNTPTGKRLKTAVGERTVRAQLFSVIADTPAAGYMSSRNISVSIAKCPCRHCENQIPKQDRLGGPGFLTPDSKDCPRLNQQRNVLLTEASEAKQRKEFSAATTKAQSEGLATKYGIKGGYTFFDAVTGFRIVHRVPHDPMHVFLEGVLKFEMYLVLHWMAKVLGWGVVTVDQMIQNHPYERTELSDKPATVAACHLTGKHPDPSGKIKQTAGMAIVLARNFVEIFGT